MNLFLTPRDKPLLIAHRGSCDIAPENTMAAFARAVELGADAIELDVQLCATGEIVVMHDVRVDRTTNGHGRVKKLSYDQLRSLDAGNHETIPTLTQIIDDFVDKVGIVIELKNLTTPLDTLARKVAQHVKDKNIVDRVMFASFLPTNLYVIKKILPSAVTCAFYLPYTGFTNLPWRRWVNVLGPAQATISKHRVVQIHRHGKLVNAWYVDTEKQAHLLQKDGVNMLTTDDVAIIRSALR